MVAAVQFATLAEADRWGSPTFLPGAGEALASMVLYALIVQAALMRDSTLCEKKGTATEVDAPEEELSLRVEKELRRFPSAEELKAWRP